MKIDKGDKVICNCEAWGIIAEIGVVSNVLEGAKNKYVVDLGDGSICCEKMRLENCSNLI